MTRLRIPVTTEDHRLGPDDAPAILVEYGDYECPFCGQAYWEVKELLQELAGSLCFVFRNFPLTQAHPNAALAAEAAEAAGAQGRFWEMHDLLYEHQEALEAGSLLAYAEALELDLRAFGDDVGGHRFQDRVRRDFLGGARSGVNGTPTFFVNGHRHDGPFTADALLEALREGFATTRL